MFDNVDVDFGVNVDIDNGDEIGKRGKRSTQPEEKVNDDNLSLRWHRCKRVKNTGYLQVLEVFFSKFLGP